MRTRTRSVFICVASIVALLMICTVYGLSTASPARPNRFDRDQIIEFQIVTVPTRSVIGGLEYDEDAVKVHSAHRFAVAASGAAQKIQSQVDGIPMNVGWKSSEADSADKTGVALHLDYVELPLAFQISPSASLRSLVFWPGRKTLKTSFTVISSIHYVAENEPHTFVRARWLNEPPPPQVVIDVVPEAKAKMD